MQPINKGFTLAEVLITIGIIGVVAAVTLPTLITKHEKKVTAEHLKKFYTIMNQAIKLEEVENGDIKNWLPDGSNGRYKLFENWYLEHFDSHIKSIYKKSDGDNITYNVALTDGSGFNAYAIPSGSIYFFYCIKFKDCGAEKFDGKKTFLFSICDGKMVTSGCDMRPFSRAVLLNSCWKGNWDDPDINSQGRRHLCTRLIEYDGWEIKDDYPWGQAPLKEK